MTNKFLITKVNLHIATRPASDQPDTLKQAMLNGWQEYRLQCETFAKPPSQLITPFDSYHVYQNCNCLIEHNSNLNINNHHLVIVFFQRGKPTRLYLGFNEDYSTLSLLTLELEKLHPYMAKLLTTSRSNLCQKPIPNPNFRPSIPENQVYPCANLPQLRSYLNQLSAQSATTTRELKLKYSPKQHLICRLDLPGQTQPGHHFEIVYKGGFFSSEAQVIFPLLQSD